MLPNNSKGNELPVKAVTVVHFLWIYVQFLPRMTYVFWQRSQKQPFRIGGGKKFVCFFKVHSKLDKMLIDFI